ncbi:MFS transporter [Novosphingobium mathurense]|uniref:MFS transporter, YNFM family, putative membrane transport protein n=1 Tax=Novosphingobium mathurense TaxID=428990 RepID=A0A1U6I7V9_9SPHN|nr:MFS transporter [Novosphingobium mathurense]SLK04077.1 MFS transporter, YNFM family, putative membrane transport protein [Novosphingobium mathurense]
MEAEKITPGTAAYRLLCIAMLLAGLSTFALLYCAQPLMPFFSRAYGVAAEEASLAVSLATGPMAFVLLVAGKVSDKLGRRPLMIASLLAAAALTTLLGLLPDWHSLLAARFLCGLALAGVPAVAMAYISEEVEDGAVGRAMGLYIAGSAIGGMSGRLLVSVLTEYFGWRDALGMTGMAGLIIAALFWKILPPSRQFSPRHHSWGGYIAGFRHLFADKALPWLFLEAFLIMGAFISIYNYAGYRLLAPPYSLSQAQVGLIFLLYLLGSLSSAVAGHFSGEFGPRKCLWLPLALFVLGIALTAASALPLIIAGIGIVTMAFFAAHAIASAWVGRRARRDRGQATACYLFFYYMGSSVLGSAGGYAWTWVGWNGVGLFSCALVLIALAVAFRLYQVAPLPSPAPETRPIAAE